MSTRFRPADSETAMERYVIIGSGSGVGAALARSLAAPGIGLLLHTGSNRVRLEATAEACRAAGAKIDLCLGTTDDPALFTAVEEWAGSLSGQQLTGFVFAAGYARLGTVTDTSAEVLARSFMAMPVAFQRLSGLLAPKLADGRGRIVCFSAFGAHATRFHSYAATAPAKAALEAQVRVFASNLAGRGITVNAVVPGYIEKEAGTPSSLSAKQWDAVTDGIPMKRLGTRDEVAGVVRFLLSPEAGYLTGQSLHINGGLTL